MAIVLCRTQRIKVGEKKNRLTAVGPSFGLRRIKDGKFQEKHPAQLFRCDCGCLVVKNVSGVAAGVDKSCGCMLREHGAEQGHKNRKHGDSRKTLLYGLWNAIKARCYYRESLSYHDYGERGISVCDEWLNDYTAFRDYALSHGWAPGLQIDRYPNNDGNYEPGNVRFVSCTLNGRNKRNNVRYEAWGESKTAAEWFEDSRCVVPFQTLLARLRLGKESPASAITRPTPTDINHRQIEAWGDSKTLYEWLADPRCLAGVQTIRNRLWGNDSYSNWTTEDAIGTPVIPRGKTNKGHLNFQRESRHDPATRS